MSFDPRTDIVSQLLLNSTLAADPDFCEGYLSYVADQIQRSGTCEQSFPLLDLPVECVTRVVAHIHDLLQRQFLYNCSPVAQFRRVLGDPKSCDGPFKLEIEFNGAFSLFCDQPTVRVAYGGWRDLVDVSDIESHKVGAFKLADLFPGRFQQTTVYYGKATRLLVAVLLNYMKKHKQSFVGSDVTLTLELNERQQLAAPIDKVMELLNEWRKRECRVSLIFCSVAKLKLPKKAAKLSDVWLSIGSYPFNCVRWQEHEGNGGSQALVNVPPCIVDPANASDVHVLSLRLLDIEDTVIGATMLTKILHKFVHLRMVSCSVVYEADSSEEALVCHTKLHRLCVTVVPQGIEDITTPDECDYYRRLVNGCPMASTVIFNSSKEISEHFMQTLLFTFCSTRASRGPKFVLSFNAEASLAGLVPCKLCLMDWPPSCKRLTEDDEDDLASLLPESIVAALSFLGGQVVEIVRPNTDIGGPNPVSFTIEVRLRGLPGWQFTVDIS